jgi:hypothetical protein
MGLTRKEKRKKERRRIIAFFESLLSFMSWKRIEEEEKKREWNMFCNISTGDIIRTDLICRNGTFWLCNSAESSFKRRGKK